MLIAVVLFATVLLRFALIGVGAYLLLPRGATCPRCSTHMALIRSPVLRILLPIVEHRWCMTCGWNGVVRLPRRGERGGRHSGVINRTARS